MKELSIRVCGCAFVFPPLFPSEQPLVSSSLLPETKKSSFNMGSILKFLTHSYLETCKRVIGKQCRLDQMPHNKASDQGLHCLLTGFSIQNRIKVTR